jgi:hypothetical protein
LDRLNLTRDEVALIVDDARQKKRNIRVHVREKLAERYPGIENLKIRRNGRTYRVLDYLEEDLSSYGPLS